MQIGEELRLYNSITIDYTKDRFTQHLIDLLTLKLRSLFAGSNQSRHWSPDIVSNGSYFPTATSVTASNKLLPVFLAGNYTGNSCWPKRVMRHCSNGIDAAQFLSNKLELLTLLLQH
ncbi:hypothetical protein AVEN_161522-1 [Araneus ventricosus]|uniref:Uncharacterized protein n=1 Tax=Araneus ventricosus TaxID=182803 RepID=A0A4Y2UUV5_ARAVE|nr:hypothetical protein AVEN_161522-1 [Araneus ventricosus]